MRATRPEELADCQQIADLLNAAFNRTFHNPWEYQNFARRAPSFRNELDLVAVAPDGTFAAYVGIPYDEANRLGIFEPVCTHPDHLRRGLARALDDRRAAAIVGCGSRRGDCWYGRYGRRQRALYGHGIHRGV